MLTAFLRAPLYTMYAKWRISLDVPSLYFMYVKAGFAKSFSFNFEELLEKVRQIKPEMVGQKMRQICREVYNAYEKANSRLTDFEEFEISKVERH